MVISVDGTSVRHQQGISANSVLAPRYATWPQDNRPSEAFAAEVGGSTKPEQ